MSLKLAWQLLLEIQTFNEVDFITVVLFFLGGGDLGGGVVGPSHNLGQYMYFSIYVLIIALYIKP
jgi:hypothetical protein